MADVLKHLETVRGERRQADSWWMPHTALYTHHDFDISADHLEHFRLKLVSQVGFAVNPGDNQAVQHATRHARERLVQHLYRPQLDIAHETMHAVYAGETRNQIADRLSKLIDSMTER